MLCCTRLCRYSMKDVLGGQVGAGQGVAGQGVVGQGVVGQGVVGQGVVGQGVVGQGVVGQGVVGQYMVRRHASPCTADCLHSTFKRLLQTQPTPRPSSVVRGDEHTLACLPQHSPHTLMAGLSQAPPVSRETRLPATARPPLTSPTMPRCVFLTAHPAGSAPAQTAPAQRPHGVQAEWANSQQQKHNTLRQRPMPLRELQKGGVCRLGSSFQQGPCQRPDTAAPFKAFCFLA